MNVRLTWIIITVIFLWMRFQNAPGVLTAEGVYPNGTDAYYRLHRISTMVQTNQVTYPLHDTKLSPPQGFDVPWPLGLDWLGLFLVKVSGATSPHAMETLISILVPFLALPTLWTLGYLACGLVSPWFSVLVMGVFSFSGIHILNSSIGEFDHHVLESFFTILCLTLYAGLRKSPASKFYLLANCLLFSLAPVFWPQAWIMCTFVFMATLMDRGNSQLFIPLSRLFLAAAGLSFLTLIPSKNYTVFQTTLFGFSIATPIFYFLISLLSAALAGIVDFKRIRSTLLTQATILALVLFFASMTPFRQLFAQGVYVLFFQNTLLNLTSEAQTIFNLDLHTMMPLGMVTLALSFTWIVFSILKYERLWLVGFSLPLIFLSCLQLRLSYLAAPILSLLACLFVHHIVESHAPTRLIKNILYGLFFVFLSYPHILFWAPTRQENVHPFFKPTVEAAKYLKAVAKPESAVLAPWDYGHWILYYSNLPVIAHPFQAGQSLASTKLWVSKGTGDLDALFPSATLLFVDAPTGKMEHWLKLFNLEAAAYFKTDAASGHRVPTRAFFDLMLPRFYFGYGVNEKGNHPANWKFIFASKYASPDNSSQTALKVFEKVSGHTLIFKHLKPKKSYALVADIILPSLREKFRYSQTLTPDAKNEITAIVPYHQESTPHLYFNGRYSLLDQDGRVLQTAIAP